MQIELEKDGLKAGRTADPASGRRSDAGYKTEQSGNQNSAKNRGREAANRQHRDQQEPEDGKQHRKRGQMARPDRRPGESHDNDAGLIQSDEGEEQSDANRVTVTERRRNRVDHPLAEAKNRHQNK